MVQKAEEILEIGLSEQEKRDQEKESFFTALRKALESNQAQSVCKVEEYEKEKAEVCTCVCKYNYV